MSIHTSEFIRSQFSTTIDSAIIEKIKEKNWYRHGSYRDTLLFATEVVRGNGTEAFVKEGIEKGVDDYIQLNGEAYITEKEYDQICLLMTKELKENKKYLKEYVQQYEKDLDKAVSESKKLKGKDFSQFSKKELLNTFKEYVLQVRELHYWLWSMEFLNPAIDELLKIRIQEHFKEIKGTELDAFIEQLSHISEKLSYQEEQEAILSLEKLEGSEFDEVFEQFRWLKMHLFDGEAFSKEEYVQRAKEIVKKKETIKQKIAEQEAKSQKAEELIDNFSSEEFKTFVTNIRKLIKVKTHRIDVYTISSYNSLGLREEISKRLGITSEELVKLSLQEIEEALLGKKIPLELFKERTKYAVVKVDGDIRQVIGEAREQVKKEIEQDFSSMQELKGNIAYKGKAKGPARIILNDREIHSVQKGDILVCNLTNPDYNPVFEKIAGLVTDEGGVLCHSAIMAREFKIPCVMNTKHATSVFKTGDVVELNAEKGTVRKVKE